MRIVVVTGLFPPDIGGPATHASQLALEFRQRGHHVTVLTLGRGLRTTRDQDLVRYPLRRPWPIRTFQGIGWLVRHRADYDLVYSTGLPLVAVPGARLARRPVVLKIVGDPAWERARNDGWTDAGFDDFQRLRKVPGRLRALRASRDWTLRGATRVITPGQRLAEWVREWVPGKEVVVIPNGVRPAATAANGDAGDAAPDGADGRLVLVSAGRLVAHKHVEVLLDAAARVDGVRLEIVGDGPERLNLERRAAELGIGDRVIFRGALGHTETMASLAAAAALVATSSYEGLPHVAIEALAQGTPVISAGTAGLREVVVDGHNGLVIDPIGPETLALALTRFRDDPSLRRSLRAGARESGKAWRFDRCADQLETLFESLTRPRPRVVFVGKTRIADPPSQQILTKYALHAQYLDQVTVATGPMGSRTVAGVRILCFPAVRPAFLGGVAFYSLAPVVALAAALRRRPSAIVCQGPFEAAGVMLARRALPPRLRPPVQVEVHGDWRTAPRLYGSRARRLVGPLSDRVGAWAIRQASQVRAVGSFTEGLAREAGYAGPIDRYLAFSLYDEFLATPVRPLPEHPRALFVGALERYKAIDLLLDAWAIARTNVPGGRLAMVGTGSMAGWLSRRIAADDLAGSVDVIEPVPQDELVRLLDASTCLLLPSRSEGLPRVVVEAMARGRAVVATAAGGIDELVVDGETGRLVAPEDLVGLAGALADVLNAPDEAARLGLEARRRIEARQPTDEYAAGIGRLAAWVTAGGPALSRTLR